MTEFARRLGVTRAALSRVLNDKATISAEMAVRLAATLGGTPAKWLHRQANYDLLARAAGAEAAGRENRADQYRGVK